MTAAIARSPVDFHVSLKVSDLARSVGFFRKLFGTEPAKLRPDYAKFVASNPRLTLALEPSEVMGTGTLSHLGFKLESSEDLVDLQARLERAGLASRREEGVECCYARQTKFWLHDPDGNLWEFYVLEDDLARRGAGQSRETMLGPPEPERSWSHHFGQPFSEGSARPDAALDSVILSGSFNEAIEPAARAQMLAEVHRMLRPGGRLVVRCLTAQRPIAGELGLRGSASGVRAVPVDGDLLREIARIGFESVRLVRFPRNPCFVSQGVELRETTIEAQRPSTAAGEDPEMSRQNS